MDHTSNLSPEILLSIFLLSENELKNLAPASKHWNQTIQKGLSTLFNSYTRSESLRPYTDLAKKTYALKDPARETEVNVQRVKLVFKEIILKAQKMGYQKESVNIQNLSAAHLQEIVKWMEEQEAKSLNVFASKIPEMQSALTSMQDLPELEKAQAIRTWMKENQDILENITTLDVDHCDLATIPKEIKYFTQLQTLNLSNNQIKVIPSEIEALTQLQVLDLSKNQITAIPSEIGSLAELQTLFLVNNQITAIPNEIGNLTHLGEIYLSHNDITVIPSAIGSLAELRTLVLSNNHIKTIPSEIGFLVELSTLRLNNNHIKTIPSQIWSLVELIELRLNNNEITAIPNQIENLIHLQQLSLKDNPLKVIPKEQISSLPELYQFDLNIQI